MSCALFSRILLYTKLPPFTGYTVFSETPQGIPHLHDVTHPCICPHLCIEHAMMRPVIHMHVECLMEILQTLQQSVTLETNVLGYMNTA